MNPFKGTDISLYRCTWLFLTMSNKTMVLASWTIPKTSNHSFARYMLTKLTEPKKCHQPESMMRTNNHIQFSDYCAIVTFVLSSWYWKQSLLNPSINDPFSNFQLLLICSHWMYQSCINVSLIRYSIEIDKVCRVKLMVST